MAKKGPRETVKIQSTESADFYMTERNKRNTPEKLELKKYDRILRKRVLFKETRSTKS